MGQFPSVYAVRLVGDRWEVVVLAIQLGAALSHRTRRADFSAEQLQCCRYT